MEIHLVLMEWASDYLFVSIDQPIVATQCTVKMFIKRLKGRGVSGLHENRQKMAIIDPWAELCDRSIFCKEHGEKSFLRFIMKYLELFEKFNKHLFEWLRKATSIDPSKK